MSKDARSLHKSDVFGLDVNEIHKRNSKRADMQQSQQLYGHIAALSVSNASLSG